LIVGMLIRPQLRPIQQRKRLRAYLRVLRANSSRAYRELSVLFRIRKGCPFELALRQRRLEDANELLKLGEKCLAEVNHCYALRLAPFQPGDQIVVTTKIRGLSPEPRRYLVLDVEWRKRDDFIYEVHELTKGGTLHKGRYPTPLFPSNRISIEKCEEPLPEETKLRACAARTAAKQLMETALQSGDLSIFLTQASSRLPGLRKADTPFWLRAR